MLLRNDVRVLLRDTTAKVRTDQNMTSISCTHAYREAIIARPRTDDQ